MAQASRRGTWTVWVVWPVLTMHVGCAAGHDRDGDTGGDAEAEVPDFESEQDFGDTDGDTIADGHEGTVDTDDDTIPDMRDLDSDGDGISDAVESGDEDILTEPADSDDDGLPDFRDLDSDNDGLADGDEAAWGTDPTEQDTDGDGAPDVVEVAAGTDPALFEDNPHERGDFVFLVPYDAPPEPLRDTLVFGTDIRMADVFFMIDRSGSMGEEIQNLLGSLETTIVPGVDDVIPDIAFGVGDLDTCPSLRECGSGGTAVGLRCAQIIDENPALTQTGLETIRDTPVCNGAYEPYVAAAWLIATDDENGPDDAWHADRVTHTECPEADLRFGWPCFREGAVPIIVEFGDAPFMPGSVCTPPTYDDLVAALAAVHARFIGISSQGTVGDGDSTWTGFRNLATDIGSVDADGHPLAFEVPENGSGLGDQVVEAIAALAGQVPMDISARAVDVVEGPGDTVDTTIFVERVEPNEVGGVEDPRTPGRICVGGLDVLDTDGDAFNDVFPDVLPGTIVCFDIVPRENVTVPPASEPQLFLGQVQVLGESVTILDTRDVYFVVPPATYDNPMI